MRLHQNSARLHDTQTRAILKKVRDKILFITKDIETAINVSSWCELASVGEVYENDEFTVEIIEV